MSRGMKGTLFAVYLSAPASSTSNIFGRNPRRTAPTDCHTTMVAEGRGYNETCIYTYR